MSVLSALVQGTLREAKAVARITRDGALYPFLNGREVTDSNAETNVETIVLLHGIATTKGAMCSLAQHLETEFPREFNVRLVGYNNSLSYSRMKRQVEDQLDEIYRTNGKTILIGYSLGANFAVDYSRREPDRTPEVIGIAPATNGARVSHLFPKKIAPELVVRTRKDSEDIAEFHPSTLPNEVRYFFIRAAEDTIVCKSRGSNGQFPNVSYLVLENVGHWSILNNSRCYDAVRARLITYLDNDG